MQILKSTMVTVVTLSDGIYSVYSTQTLTLSRLLIHQIAPTPKVTLPHNQPRKIHHLKSLIKKTSARKRGTPLLGHYCCQICRKTSSYWTEHPLYLHNQ